MFFSQVFAKKLTIHSISLTQKSRSNLLVRRHNSLLLIIHDTIFASVKWFLRTILWDRFHWRIEIEIAIIYKVSLYDAHQYIPPAKSLMPHIVCPSSFCSGFVSAIFSRLSTKLLAWNLYIYKWCGCIKVKSRLTKSINRLRPLKGAIEV